MLVDPSPRSKPRARHRNIVADEAGRLRRVLDLFERLIELAADENDPDRRLTLEELAWHEVSEAEPIRVSHAAQLLDTSDRTVATWAHRGVLDERSTRPRRVSLDSVLRTRQLIERLRELGRDRDLLTAILDKLESDELAEDDRFQRSLNQMRRGERGSWPKRWAGKV